MKRRRIVYWHSLYRRPPEEQFLECALQELGQRLWQHAGLRVVPKKLPKKLACGVVNAFRWERDFIHMAAAVSARIGDRPGLLPGVIVLCPEDSFPARDARRINPEAEWAASCGRLAIVWRPDNKELVWHEVLQLLGVTNCFYDGEGGHACEKEPGCLMQEMPIAESVAFWPDCLCLGTVDHLLRAFQPGPRRRANSARVSLEAYDPNTPGHAEGDRRHYVAYRQWLETPLRNPVRSQEGGQYHLALGACDVECRSDAVSSLAHSLAFQFCEKTNPKTLLEPDRQEVDFFRDHLSRVRRYKKEFPDGSFIEAVYPHSFRACPKCLGEGTIQNPLLYNELENVEYRHEEDWKEDEEDYADDEGCESCRGTGFEPCQDCGGFGGWLDKTECLACNGTGRNFSEPCKHCRGEGSEPCDVTCPFCGGTGEDPGDFLDRVEKDARRLTRELKRLRRQVH